MINLKVSITDAAAASKALAAFGDNLAARLEGFLKREGAEMEKELKQSLSVSAHSGVHPAARSYRDRPAGRRIKEYTASSPGEPPRLRTGNLRAAQGYKVAVNKSSGDFILDVGGVRGGKTEVKYQRGLEEGTSTTAARPHLMPIVQKHLAAWPKGITVEVKEAGKGAARKSS